MGLLIPAKLNGREAHGPSTAGSNLIIDGPWHLPGANCPFLVSSWIYGPIPVRPTPVVSFSPLSTDRFAHSPTDLMAT